MRIADDSSARVVDGPAEVERRPELVQPGQQSGDPCPDHERAGEDEVEDPEQEDGRGDRGVAAVLDAALGQEDADDVAAAGGHDRVDADAGEHGRDDRPPADLLARIRRRDDVLPGAADRQKPQDVERDSEQERAPAEVVDPVPEDLDRVPDRVDQALRRRPEQAGGLTDRRRYRPAA